MALPHEMGNNLEDLDTFLYKKDQEPPAPKRHGVSDHTTLHSPKNWSDVSLTDPETPGLPYVKKTSSVFKKFFISSIIFFILAVGFAVLMLLSKGNGISSDNVDLNIMGSTFSPAGEEVEYAIAITNRNPVPLQVSDLIVSFSKNGERTSDTPSDVSRSRISLGTIEPGQTVTQKVPLTLYGPEASKKEVEFELEYKIPDSTALFNKIEKFVVTLSSSPLTLTTEGAPVAISGQEYSFGFFVQANTKEPIKNLFVKVEYPNGFTPLETDPKPDSLNNGWLISELPPGEFKHFRVQGTFQAQNGEERSFRIYAGTQDERDTSNVGISFNSMIHLVTITRPFLETQVIVNGEKNPEVALSNTGEVTVDIPWRNNLPSTVRQGEIIVSFEGDILDRESIHAPGGYFDSRDNTITWNQNTLSELREIIPGQTGRVGFSFSLLEESKSVENPKIILKTTTKAVEDALSGSVPLVIENQNTTTLKLVSGLVVTSETLFRKGPFKNAGSIPPTVDRETTYTIHFSVENGANDLSKVIIKAVLPPYVEYKETFSPNNSIVSYNSKTREITWDAGSILGKTGVSGTPPKELFFKVGITPSLSLLGSQPVLVQEGQLTAYDTFANTSISRTVREVTTNLRGDGNYSEGSGNVVK